MENVDSQKVDIAKTKTKKNLNYLPFWLFGVDLRDFLSFFVLEATILPSLSPQYKAL